MSDLERLAQWMLSESIPTGHGDEMDGLLEALGEWAADVRAERDRCRAALESIAEGRGSRAYDIACDALEGKSDE